jgi:hypothetical protein
MTSLAIDASTAATPSTFSERGRRAAKASMVFGVWGIFGLYIDGWSHGHNKPETFFTPWHAILYSAFAAGTIWFGIDELRHTIAHGTRSEKRVSDRYAFAGGALFAAGGIGDFLWHSLFGIEADTEALLSPTHLLLMLGALTMGAGVVIDRWFDAESRDGSPAAATDARLVTFALGLGAALVGFFLQFASPFVIDVLLRGEGAQTWQIATILVFTPLLLAPGLLASRRWTLPRGSVFVASLPMFVGMATLEAFDQWATCAAILVGGIVADALLTGRPSHDARGARLAGVFVPAATWLAYFGAMSATTGMTWAAEMWTGSIIMSAVTGLALSLMAAPPKIPTEC